MLTRLRLDFSHVCEHKFRYDFKDTLNSLWSCSIEDETTTHYFLHCYFYNSYRSTLMNVFENILIYFSTISDNNIKLVCFYMVIIISMTQEPKNINVNYQIHLRLTKVDKQLF